MYCVGPSPCVCTPGALCSLAGRLIPCIERPRSIVVRSRCGITAAGEPDTGPRGGTGAGIGELGPSPGAASASGSVSMRAWGRKRSPIAEKHVRTSWKSGRSVAHPVAVGGAAASCAGRPLLQRRHLRRLPGTGQVARRGPVTLANRVSTRPDGSLEPESERACPAQTHLRDAGRRGRLPGRFCGHGTGRWLPCCLCCPMIEPLPAQLDAHFP